MHILSCGRALWLASGLLGALLLAVPVAHAACELEQGDISRAVAIVDGDTVVLDNGRQVRFTGIQAPKLPLGRANFETWPLAGDAHAALSALALGKPVTLRHGGRRDDRHGRILAHLFIADANGREVWLQREMLRVGLARVYTFRDNRACAAELLAAEREARQAQRGIWADPFYAIRDAADVTALERLSGSFELVEGRVVSAAVVRDRIYFNFGADWRTDFTVTVASRDARLFLDDRIWGALLDQDGGPSGIENRRVRVRGWLGRYNGPEITVTHPEQIELLDDTP
ncbi:MAG: thermonuclease family protein [Parvibaculum sp.]|uniref:thermonuclease family protein n=1 Tax=Parvibaculum sp. TaxID=2024848 RepID=UPI00271EF219|nr:thermonuclease family protein [Parvibaculum sp.]MDO8840669.1 thermonuclease family protein [Parvibaculum sp.]